MAAAPLFNKPEAIVHGIGYVNFSGGYQRVAMTTDSLVEELMPTMDEIQSFMSNGAKVDMIHTYVTENGVVDISSHMCTSVRLIAYAKDAGGQQWRQYRNIVLAHETILDRHPLTRREGTITRKKGGEEREEGTELLDARQFGQQPAALPAQNGDGPDRPAPVEQKSDGAGSQSGNGAKLG